MDERFARLRDLHAGLVALEQQRRDEARHLRIGAYTFVALVAAVLVVADHAWGLGLWIGIRELLLHVR